MAKTLRVDSRREIPEGHGAALLVLALVRLIERRNRQRVAAEQMDLEEVADSMDGNDSDAAWVEPYAAG